MNNSKLIFIVDDDPFINMLVIKRFASESLHFIPFIYGEECINSLDKNPDLIILDYCFVNKERKVMNGLEVFENIRTLKPGIPVIMCSCQERGDVLLDLAKKGINDYIIKDDDLIPNLNMALNGLLETEIA